jgi:competence protein ComEC
LPAEEAGLASGLILGEKALISAELKRNLQVSGTTHIIALSGYNITIILGLFAFLKTKASRLMNLIIPTVFILSFVVMTGAAASIVRAAIMGFMPIFARYIGRPANNIMAILVSAFLMLLFNPYLALYDVGFQLSFMAMVGLMYIGPLIHGLFPKQNSLTLILAETLSAQIAVLPLIIFNFGVVSVISPFSNLSILLLVPVGMFVSFLTGFSGIFHPLLRKLASLAAFPLLKVINFLVSFFGGLPFASFQYTVTNPIWVFVMYFVIFDLVYLLKNLYTRKLLAVYQKAEASVV